MSPKLECATNNFIEPARIHDPPNEVRIHWLYLHDGPLNLLLHSFQGTEDVTFHSLFTDEGKRGEDGVAERYQAIQTKDKPLDFFNE